MIPVNGRIQSFLKFKWLKIYEWFMYGSFARGKWANVGAATLKLCKWFIALILPFTVWMPLDPLPPRPCFRKCSFLFPFVAVKMKCEAKDEVETREPSFTWFDCHTGNNELSRWTEWIYLLYSIMCVFLSYVFFSSSFRSFFFCLISFCLASSFRSLSAVAASQHAGHCC